MGALNTFTQADAQATPVVHTFTPVVVDTGYISYEELDVVEYIGRYKVVTSITRPKGMSKDGSNRNIKVHVRVELPTLETLSNDTYNGIAPSATLAYRTVGSADFILPERSTQVERESCRTMLSAILLKTNVAGDLVDLYQLPY